VVGAGPGCDGGRVPDRAEARWHRAVEPEDDGAAGGDVDWRGADGPGARGTGASARRRAGGAGPSEPGKARGELVMDDDTEGGVGPAVENGDRERDRLPGRRGVGERGLRHVQEYISRVNRDREIPAGGGVVDPVVQL